MDPAPIRRLAVGAIGVGAFGTFQALQMLGVPSDPIFGAVVSVLGGSLTSVTANALNSVDAIRLLRDGDILANHDLRRLIGQAIGVVLTEVAGEIDEP